MTFEQLAEIVAADFIATMKEEHFDTFTDMIICYWWTPTDIKNEVDAILREKTPAYIDEADRTDVILNDDLMPYRKFSRMFRRIISENLKGGETT